MHLKEIYQPISRELGQVEELLRASLKKSKNKSVFKISDYLLNSGGKRLRPALVSLSARATLPQKPGTKNQELVKIASAVELVHIASLIHDDVIDEANLRHNKPTINSRYGRNVSIALGDYLYSRAFELVASCGSSDILSCIAQATALMCEGELVQVCERDNLSLLKEHYLIIVKKKTASLFAASCQAGAMLSRPPDYIRVAFKEYGLNFGIAFQIVDDCLDLVSSTEKLGKAPGSDFKMGELTLPVLNLLSQSKDKNRVLALIKRRDDEGAFKELRQRFVGCAAFHKTREDVCGYVRMAKKSLDGLGETLFKKSLVSLADFVLARLL